MKHHLIGPQLDGLAKRLNRRMRVAAFGVRSTEKIVGVVVGPVYPDGGLEPLARLGFMPVTAVPGADQHLRAAEPERQWFQTVEAAFDGSICHHPWHRMIER